MTIRVPIVYVYNILITRGKVHFQKSLTEQIDSVNSRAVEAMAIRDKKVEEILGDIDLVSYDSAHPYGTFITKRIKARCVPLAKIFMVDQLEEAQAWVAKIYAERGVNSSVTPNLGATHRTRKNKLLGPEGQELPTGVLYVKALSKANGDRVNRSALYTVTRMVDGEFHSKSFSITPHRSSEQALQQALKWRDHFKILVEKAIVEKAQDGVGSSRPIPLVRDRPSMEFLYQPKRLGHRGQELPKNVNYRGARRVVDGAVRNMRAAYTVSFRLKGVNETKVFSFRGENGDQAFADAMAWRQTMIKGFDNGDV